MTLPRRIVKIIVVAMFASGPRPSPSQVCLTRTWSATSMKSVFGAIASKSQVSRSCLKNRITASRPIYGPGSGPIRDRVQDDIRVVHFTKTIHVPGVPCVERCLDDLHVLLRHRLLRQPRRFEGFGAVEEHLRRGHLAVAQPH